ncbi:MAG: glycosyltransferase [Ginsengibacter sp.]
MAKTKIAIIDHLNAAGGLIRFSNSLAFNIAALNKNIKIDYYINYHSLNDNADLFRNPPGNLTIKVLDATRAQSRFGRYGKSILEKTFRIKKHNPLIDELTKKINGYQAIYFSAPHMSQWVPVEGNKFGTFHDFNWKYLFGTPIFSKSTVEFYESELSKWFADTKPVVSTNFIESELKKFYPEATYVPRVIYLPSLGRSVVQNSESSLKILKKHELNYPYILYPAHFYAHKNHLNLIVAFSKLKETKDFKHHKLVFTGTGTDHFKKGKATKYGLEKNESDYDVIGLGYISNNEIDAIISGAKLVISTSLYEAGSGPALDAWSNRTPFIMSDIPAHKDQLDFFNIDCLLFDPFDTNDIADKMAFSLKNIDISKNYSEKADLALQKYTWTQAGQQYLQMFLNN